MLSILADALLIAARLDAHTSYGKYPSDRSNLDRNTDVNDARKRQWAQYPGMR